MTDTVTKGGNSVDETGEAAETPPASAQRPRSLQSWRSRSSLGRSRSRPRSPSYHLHRIYSSGYLDQHGTYLSEQDFDAAQNTAMPSEPEPGTAALPPAKPRYDGQEEIEESEEDKGDEVNDLDGGKEGEVDLEKATSLRRQETSKSAKSARSYNPSDPNFVSWDGPDDVENPKNWAKKRKWAAVLVVSSFTFISPVSSSMVAPALDAMGQDLGVTDDVLLQMMLSIFILAYAIGPLFLGPLSEVYGRVPVLQLGNLFFLVFNLGCGFAQTGPQMLVMRFFAGLGGSAPLAIGGGILADCFNAEERGRAIGIYSLAPLIGPAAGPIAGGFITENTTWRWVFWAVTIADALIQVSGLFFLQETWAPKLLEQKVRRLQKTTGNEELYSAERESTFKKLEVSLGRPFRMLFTQPIIMVLAIYMAYLYGLVYLIISTFPTLFTSAKYYDESVQIGGLNYISLAVGYFIGAQSTARFNDWLYGRLKRRNNGIGKPEFRVPVLIPCAILLPAGFFWYGWSAEAKIHWIMPDIGAAILAAATINGYYAIQTYIIDSYTKYAASAIAAIATLRSLAGFGFPLFAPAMYDALGYGWGNSVLAFVAIVMGVPAPWFFWKFGARLRAKSQYAAGG